MMEPSTIQHESHRTEQHEDVPSNGDQQLGVIDRYGDHQRSFQNWEQSVNGYPQYPGFNHPWNIPSNYNGVNVMPNNRWDIPIYEAQLTNYNGYNVMPNNFWDIGKYIEETMSGRVNYGKFEPPWNISANYHHHNVVADQNQMIYGYKGPWLNVYSNHDELARLRAFNQFVNTHSGNLAVIAGNIFNLTNLALRQPPPRCNQYPAKINTPPKKSTRVTLTEHQLDVLKKTYEQQRYLSRKETVKLATTLNLEKKNVQIWFQCRRMADKRRVQRPTE